MKNERIVMLGLCLTLTTAPGCSCSKKGSTTQADRDLSITVLRVESASPEQAGAEHCNDAGQDCKPLAVSQKLPASGQVRTFAGGRVSLDLGGGRRVDLDGLSQTKLSPQMITLEDGTFSVDSTPLIQREAVEPLRLKVHGKEFTSDQKLPTTTILHVTDDDAQLTVQRGQLTQKDDGLTSRAGESLRLTQASAFRTAEGGGELAALVGTITHKGDYGDLLEASPKEQRGLGTMSARLPNTTQMRDGVELLAHHVRVTIEDGFARTEVEEEFINKTPHILEGQYKFPVPGDASVSRLALWVGDTLMEGEVLEKERASSIYKSIVDRPVPRDPALLEWVSGGSMSLRVFPILPQKTRKMILAYEQALQGEGGRLRYVYPLSFGENQKNNIENFSISVVAKDRLGKLSHPSSPNYSAEIKSTEFGFSVDVKASRIAPSKDFELVFDRAASEQAQVAAYVGAFKPQAQVRSSSGALPPIVDQSGQKGAETVAPDVAADGHFALRMQVDLPEGTPRPGFLALRRAIVLDVSQSQSQETIRAQAALAFGLLRDMDPEEEFVLLACDSACSSHASWSQSATENGVSSEALPLRLARAQSFLKALRPGGSSDLSGAIAAASVQLAQRPSSPDIQNQVVLMGDGGLTSGDLSAARVASRVVPLLLRQKSELRIVGVGQRLDSDALRGLAVELGATFEQLGSGTSLGSRIDELSAHMRRPVLRGAKLDLPSGMISADSYALPALYLGQELTVTGEIENMGTGPVVLKGQLNGQEYRLQKSLSWDRVRDSQNTMVPRLWARARIAFLQALEQTPARQKEIIDLSMHYRTMSRYTSFLVLESDEMFQQFGVEQKAKGDSKKKAEEPRPLPPPPGDEPYLGEFTRPGEAPFDMAPNNDFSRDNDQESRVSSESEDEADLGLGSVGDGLGRGTSGGARSASSSGAPSSAAPKASMVPRPAPRPASKPQMLPASPSSDAFEGASPREEAAKGAVPSKIDDCIPGTWGCGGVISQERFRRPRPITSHFTFQAADDAWRSWGEERVTQLSETLKRDPKSRARQVAYISGLLQHGWFQKARPAALEFVSMDPDNPEALRLLSYASVVDGDHEQARRAIDMLVETKSQTSDLHLEALQSFHAVGDVVRACAHLRSMAELSPEDGDLAKKANDCWSYILGEGPAFDEFPEGKSGQLTVEVLCSGATQQHDCPAPVLVAPDGQVISPWTPGVGKSTRTSLTLTKVRSGEYYVMILGGAPTAQGTLKLVGKDMARSFAFEGGSLRTIARAQVRFW